ncbi:MAG: hypothetical protein OXM55_02440 [Bdellovibrionales bacterium]|nr:hypothetical protein [Bdellovibrionales bacterium]
MSYIKLQIRSGGIYIKQKKDFLPIDLNLISHPEKSQQKVLPLVRDSSIKGLFSFLMGETGSIKNTIENNRNSEVQKLNATLNKIVEKSAYNKILEPYITTFFERKDIHTQNIVFDPNINLYQYNFERADPTIKLFEKPLKNLFKIESLGVINKGFQDSKITNTNSEYERLKPPSCNNIPDYGIGQKMKSYFNKFKDKQKPIYSKTLELINETNSLCLTDIKFRVELEESNYKKWSVFEMPSQTRHWVNKNYHKIVRGTPAYIACVDFDVYLSESIFLENNNSKFFSWTEIVNKLKAGPNIARWGEGGIVFIDYSGLDEMGCPHNQKDQMFVEIQA